MPPNASERAQLRATRSGPAKKGRREENGAHARKTKKSVFRRACPRAQTRRRPRKIQKTTQSRRAPRKTYEAPHTQRRGRQTPPRRPSRRPARPTRESAKLLQTFCGARATRAGEQLPRQAADASHTRRAAREKSGDRRWPPLSSRISDSSVNFPSATRC